MIGNVSLTEVLFILVVALLLFGRRLPDVARSFGRSFAEFKRALNSLEQDVQGEIRKQVLDDSPPEKPPADQPCPPDEYVESPPHDDGTSGPSKLAG